MKKILLFDCDGVAWSVFHAMGNVLSHEGSGTSVIHGFLNHVFALQAFEKADMLVFAWDTYSAHRKALFPGYKEKREQAKLEYTEEEKEIHVQRSAQFKLLREEILFKLGFSNVFSQEGYEGDDIIASIVEDYKSKYYIKMVARDKDLYQLIDSNVVMYDPVKASLITTKTIRDKYGIEPHQFKDVKSIYGCDGDEVPGVQGIGEKTAIKYVKGTLPFTYKAYQAIEKASSVIALTRKLVVLPFEGTNSFKIQNDTCLPNKLKSIARVYGLKSFVTDGRMYEYNKNFCDRNFDSTVKEKDVNVSRMGSSANNLSDF